MARISVIRLFGAWQILELGVGWRLKVLWLGRDLFLLELLHFLLL